MNNLSKKHSCLTCGIEFDEKEMKSVQKGFICKQCSRYRKISLLILIIGAFLAEFLFIVLLFAASNANMSFFVVPGPYLIMLLVIFGYRPLARYLSVRAYKKKGIVVPEKVVTTQNDTTSHADVRKAYIAGEYKNTSEEEKQLIEEYRTAPDNIREEVLMILSLDPVPDRKRKKYRSYSMQEASIILTYRNSSKAIQNKVFDVLNKSKRA